MWRVIVERGANKGKSFKLMGNGSISIGRSSKNGITLDDALVSRLHCRLVCHEDRLILQDCGSHNGTQVNNRNVQKVELKTGDLLTLGESEVSIYKSEQPDKLIGQTVHGYEFSKRIGRGGGGTVYLARQVRLDRDVAVKVLPLELSANATAVQRFLDEARLAATLSHPRLVGIHDIVSEDKLCFFSMEYMVGGSLGERALTEKKLPWKEVIDVIIQSCEGLAYIHSKGLVHRDIKPANLMIDAGGGVKIGDFGIANKGEVSDGKITGSPHFMSPEQARGKELDSRSDLYSLGCTAFRLMSGMPPFIGASLEAVLVAHVRDEAPRFKTAVEGISPKVAKVFDTLLEKDPDNRFATAQDVVAALQEARKPRKPLRGGTRRRR